MDLIGVIELLDLPSPVYFNEGNLHPDFILLNPYAERLSDL